MPGSADAAGDAMSSAYTRAMTLDVSRRRLGLMSLPRHFASICFVRYYFQGSCRPALAMSRAGRHRLTPPTLADWPRYVRRERARMMSFDCVSRGRFSRRELTFSIRGACLGDCFGGAGRAHLPRTRSAAACAMSRRSATPIALWAGHANRRRLPGYGDERAPIGVTARRQMLLPRPGLDLPASVAGTFWALIGFDGVRWPPISSACRGENTPGSRRRCWRCA